MRVHIVANLTARGLLRGHAPLAWLRQKTNGRVHLHPTSHISELGNTMRQILDDGVDLLLLAGGDGTFMSGVTAMDAALNHAKANGAGGNGAGSNGAKPNGGSTQKQASAWPTVGLLPMGTVGTVARNIGERGKPKDLLESWLTEPDDVCVLPQPTMRIEASLADGTIESRVGFIIGTGLVARFFEVYVAQGSAGLPLAAKVVARVFAESFTGGPLAKQILTPLPCSLRVDGDDHPASGLSLLCAAVVRDMGLGMKVCYRAGEDPGRIHIVASSLLPSQLGPRLPYVFMGRTIGGENHVDRLASSFEIEFPGDDGPYVVDGDLLRAKRIRVSPGPVIPVIGPRPRSGAARGGGAG